MLENVFSWYFEEIENSLLISKQAKCFQIFEKLLLF